MLYSYMIYIYAMYLYIILIVIYIDNTFGESRYEDDTRAALAEMSKLFRHLFPLVPDKAHYIWKASHLGGSLTLDQPRHHSTTYIEHIENPATNTRHSSTPQSESNANIREEQQFDDLSVSASAPTIPTPVLNPILANNYHIIKSGRRMQTTPLGKRGPECMRKCIAQGVLHPVQCHSLC